MRLRLAALGAAALLVPTAAFAAAPESSAAKIARALSAGPASVTAAATVADMDAKGNMAVLRKGTNGWTCIAGHKGVVGDDPMCMDAAAMEWGMAYFAHKKPTNKKPGIAYMLAGGSDWSASDPYATSGTPIHEPPHWMMLWPFTAKDTGLPTTAKDTGTWIMYAGTPYAHLMINGKP